MQAHGRPDGWHRKQCESLLPQLAWLQKEVFLESCMAPSCASPKWGQTFDTFWPWNVGLGLERGISAPCMRQERLPKWQGRYGNANHLLTERVGRTGGYWPDGQYKTTQDKYSPVRLELARLVSSLLYGTRVMLVSFLLKLHLTSKGFLRNVLLMTRASPKEQATTSLKTNWRGTLKVNPPRLSR